jgi:hypothetical protein
VAMPVVELTGRACSRAGSPLALNPCPAAAPATCNSHASALVTPGSAMQLISMGHRRLPASKQTCGVLGRMMVVLLL